MQEYHIVQSSSLCITQTQLGLGIYFNKSRKELTKMFRFEEMKKGELPHLKCFHNGIILIVISIVGTNIKINLI
jgi:hypothetical protein